MITETITDPSRLLPKASIDTPYPNWMVMSDSKLEYAKRRAERHGCHSGWDDTYYAADAELKRRERIKKIERGD